MPPPRRRSQFSALSFQFFGRGKTHLKCKVEALSFQFLGLGKTHLQARSGKFGYMRFLVLPLCIEIALLSQVPSFKKRIPNY